MSKKELSETIERHMTDGFTKIQVSQLDALDEEYEATVDSTAQNIRDLFILNRIAVTKILRKNETQEKMGFADLVYQELQGIAEDYKIKEGGFLPVFDRALETYKRLVELQNPSGCKSKKEKEHALQMMFCRLEIEEAKKSYPIGTKLRLGNKAVRILEYEINTAEKPLLVFVHFDFGIDFENTDAVLAAIEEKGFDEIFEPQMEIHEFEEAIIQGNAAIITE